MLCEKELQVALKAVSAACALCRKARETFVRADSVAKKDRSPVTIADFGSQAVISLSLMNAFPDDPIIAEEDIAILRDNSELRRRVAGLVDDQLGNTTEEQVLAAVDAGAGDADFTGRFWTLDPIDGTKGFLRGDQYAVALALVEEGQVVLGVLGCPSFRFTGENTSRGHIFYAVRGEGTFTRPLDGGDVQRIAADRISAAKDARFCESVESAHAAHEVHAQIGSALRISAQPFRIDSQAKYGAVAAGMASIYLRLPRSSEYREKIWDHAAGTIVVEEARGRVTDFSGKPLDFSAGRTLKNNVGILATNGRLHEAVLKAISDVREEK